MAVADIESALETGRLDVGISFLPPTKKALTGEKLFSEELVAVVAANHPLAHRKKSRVRDLESYPLALLSPKYCTRQLIDCSFNEAGIKPDIRVEMNSISGLLSTVRRTGMVTLLPSLALCEQESGLRTISLIQPTPRRSVGLVWMHGANRRAAALAFAQVTQTVLTARNLASS
jgi:LysR family cyn operon transcriptional activator